MMGQSIAEHLNESGEQNKARSEKLQRRAAARKIGKIIKRCKAETKAVKKLDDEQKEFLERLRKHF
jgi:predicted RNase H-like nuclease (RuvC/YqgF family)